MRRAKKHYDHIYDWEDEATEVVDSRLERELKKRPKEFERMSDDEFTEFISENTMILDPRKLKRLLKNKIINTDMLERIMRFGRRRYERIPSVGPILIYSADLGGAKILCKGQGRNLSIKGVAVQGAFDELQVGQVVNLEFLGNMKLKPISIQAEIANFTPLFKNSGASWSVGLKFISMTKLTHRILAEYTRAMGRNVKGFSDIEKE